MSHLIEQLRVVMGPRYAVGAEIGRGGMSVVYRARDFAENRDVAVKVLRAELAATIAVDRFLREIEIANQLQHPSILPVYDAGHVDGVPFFIMPFVDGESLRNMLDREKQLPLDEAIRIAGSIAHTLEYAHSRGVVHRDIKPENILLAGERVVLTDFGIARAVAAAAGVRLTESGIALGTPAYLSPEQAGGAANVDARADVYALGCVLYEMLAGEPPFTGPTAQIVVARHMAEPFRSLRVIRPAVPPELDDVLRRALEKVPADRFGSAAGFADSLAEVGNATRLRRRRIRRQVIRASAALAVALAIIGAAALTLRERALDVDPTRIVVFPLRGGSDSLAEIGYDVSLMIGAALEHTDPLKWIDGRQDLAEYERTNATLMSTNSAAIISRSRKARFFIEGAVRRDLDSMTVVLRLHDASGDSLIVQESASGSVNGVQPYQLGLAATKRLLPRLLAPGQRIDLAALTDRSPAAIALWMQGEREYRNTRFANALEFYTRAVAEDSALVFAAVKGAQAANWLMKHSAARQLTEVALRRIQLLPPRYQYFGRGLAFYLDAAPDSAVLWLERARAADPEWEEASTALGEVFYHLFPTKAPLDSLAESHFQLALATDSMFTPPMLHLIEIAARRGDRERTKNLMSRLRPGEPDTILARERSLIATCLERGPQATDWRASAKANPVAALLAAQHFSAGVSHPLCAEAGFRAVYVAAETPNIKWSALLGLHSVLSAQKRTDELIALIDEAAAGGLSQAVFLYVLDVTAGLPLRHKAAAFDAQARQRFGNQYEGASPYVLWLLALWHAHEGNEAAVQYTHRELTARLQTDTTRRTRLLRDAVHGHLQLARGDTTAALTSFRAINPSANVSSLLWDIFEPLAVERLTLAKLLARRAEWEEARRVASGFDHPAPAIYPIFVPASLELRLAAAEALGHRAEVSRIRKRLNSLRRSESFASVVLP